MWDPFNKFLTELHLSDPNTEANVVWAYGSTVFTALYRWDYHDFVKSFLCGDLDKDKIKSYDRLIYDICGISNEPFLHDTKMFEFTVFADDQQMPPVVGQDMKSLIAIKDFLKDKNKIILKFSFVPDLNNIQNLLINALQQIDALRGKDLSNIPTVFTITLDKQENGQFKVVDSIFWRSN